MLEKMYESEKTLFDTSLEFVQIINMIIKIPFHMARSMLCFNKSLYTVRPVGPI